MQMDELINNFIRWWKSPNSELADRIFHESLYIQDCALGNAKELWLSDTANSDLTDWKLLKVFSSNNEGLVSFEQTSEITLLYYRFSIYLKSVDNKIIEIISTKESVAKEQTL